MPKIVNCTGCGEQHKIPAGKKCPTLKNMNNDSDSDAIVTGSSTDMNQDILPALTSVSSRLTVIESRITKTVAQLSQQATQSTSFSDEPVSVRQKTTPRRRRTSSSDDNLLPSMAFLKENKHIQDQVDSRIRELSNLRDKGTIGANEVAQILCELKPRSPGLSTKF